MSRTATSTTSAHWPPWPVPQERQYTAAAARRHGCGSSTRSEYPGYDDAEPHEPDVLLDGGERLQLGPYAIDVRFVPGHSPGSLAFGIDGALYAGDVLFRGSVGRTDLREGDWPTLQASIASLLEEFPPETPVLSGHGEPTTLGAERASNPFLEELRR